MTQHLRHGFLDSLVRDSLFRLVLVRGLVRKGGNHEQKTVLDVSKRDLALVFIIFPGLL